MGKTDDLILMMKSIIRFGLHNFSFRLPGPGLGGAMRATALRKLLCARYALVLAQLLIITQIMPMRRRFTPIWYFKLNSLNFTRQS